MNKKILILSIAPLFAFPNAEYFSIIGNDNYKVVSDIIDEVGEWIDIGEADCFVDIEVDEVYFDRSFDQIESCSQIQERTITSKIIEEDGSETVISERKEKQTVHLEDTISTLVGTHLEQSCDNIIVNNYADEDGVYKIGIASDNFDVYCDMRIDEGWTLIGKVNTANIDGINEPQNWFQSGQNTSKVLSPVDEVNKPMAALGINTVNKIDHKNVAEFFIISEDYDDQIRFYKEVTQNNIENWFVSSEVTNVKTCLDSKLTNSCVSNTFSKGTTYILSGMNISKQGYSATGDLHFRFNENSSPHHSSLCSHSFNYDNNKWGDIYNDHWGNALLIYIK